MRLIAATLIAALIVPACSAAPRAKPMTLGAILIGEHDDLGYNQAIWEGLDAVARAFPDLRILRREDVPEQPVETPVAAMEAMIDDGATILFATSFGHLAAAVEVARRHPDVIVLHQGGVEPEPGLPNLGTYWGTIYEIVYEAGIAAGAATKTDRLGFVAAFPIPATLNNINAFTLGARSVNPRARTLVRFTGDWCAPDEQRIAARDLLRAGADVLTQHQDCTGTVLREAERAGVWSVGYHADGSEVAPKGWLVGAVWNWRPTFVAIIRTILDGTFPTSAYEGDFRGSLATGDSPFVLTEPGPSVSDATRRDIARAERRFARGDSPFDGPVTDRDGVLRIPAGTAPSVATLDGTDYVVRGVRGTIPTPG